MGTMASEGSEVDKDNTDKANLTSADTDNNSKREVSIVESGREPSEHLYQENQPDDTTQLTTSKENGDLSTATLKTDDGSATHVKTPAEVAPQNEAASGEEEGDEALDEMGLCCPKQRLRLWAEG